MKLPPPALSPLPRCDAQGDLLALLFTRPGEDFSLSEVARRVGLSVPAVHAEVGRLGAAGPTADGDASHQPAKSRSAKGNR